MEKLKEIHFRCWLYKKYPEKYMEYFDAEPTRKMYILSRLYSVIKYLLTTYIIAIVESTLIIAAIMYMPAIKGISLLDGGKHSLQHASSVVVFWVASGFKIDPFTIDDGFEEAMEAPETSRWFEAAE